MMNTLVLDLDGTILPDSEEKIKQRALYLVFEDYGEEVPVALIDEIRRVSPPGSITRYDVFEYVFKGQGYSEDVVGKKVEEYAHRYDDVVKAHTLTLGVPQSHLLALTELAKEYSLYINSVTPEDSLPAILEGLHISDYFKGSFGSPKNKVENLERVAVIEKITASDIVFVGDGENDRQAAERFGCRFIGFSNNWNKWNEAEKPFPVIRDLEELKQYL